MAPVWLLLVWPLLGLCVRPNASPEPPRSPGLDLLLPYTRGHGPAHSHRWVRDCQPQHFGNSTHQSHRADASQGDEAQSKSFVTSVSGSSPPRWVYGHLTVVSDPLRTLSVLEPGSPGGCGRNRSSTVEQTARTRGCLYAQNAGFFHTDSRQCIGNVVSEGRLVQSSGVQNAQFGIRKDGTLVFGYLSEEEVLQQNNPFVQLVSGVVWLLRDGQVYINHSLQAECDKTQETGSLRYFVDVVSARTAVGHDAAGRVVLVQIDGQTGGRGMNLWEFADFLKDNGLINAINLDGGGSATFVKDGALASYPSDHCVPDGRWRCARAVSTVLCVHARGCGPGCGEHGACGGGSGRCECESGWSGESCERPPCEAQGCGQHGICTKKNCVCDAGWTGQNCSQVCPSGLFGDGCNQSCSCLNGAHCDAVHGSCSCTPGFTGDKCQHECPVGWFGASCSEECNCSDSCHCDAQSGLCNVSVTQATNHTLHTVGKCMAKRLFETWRQEEETQLEQRYLSERSWLIFSLSVSVLLLSLSLSLHLLSWCRSSSLSPHSQLRDYSYVPLHDINGSLTSALTGKTGTGLSQGDSDSEEEVWTPHSDR